jgi:transposase-like protein
MGTLHFVAIGLFALSLLALSLCFAPGGRSCPKCATPLPWFRLPQNRRQAMYGGWTCPNCGREINREGRKRARRSHRKTR